MGEEVSPDDPTRSAGVTEPETQSVYAWGLADEPDEPEPRRATPMLVTAGAVTASLALVGVAAVLAWQHLHVEEAPASAAESSIVPAAMTPVTTTAAPVAAPPPPPAPPAVTVTTVVVQTPAPPAQQPHVPTHSGVTPEAMAAYDREFIARMQNSNWRIDDAGLMALRAHQVCEEFALGSSPTTVHQKLMNALGMSPTGASTFMSNATLTYPDCP
jgi:hypothetical protein